jgi:hypothetical protein
LPPDELASTADIAYGSRLAGSSAADRSASAAAAKESQVHRSVWTASRLATWSSTTKSSTSPASVLE